MKLGNMVGTQRPPKRRKQERSSDDESERTFVKAWDEYIRLQDAGDDDAADEIMDEMINEWPADLEAKLSSVDALLRAR